METKPDHLSADEYRRIFWHNAAKHLPHHAAIKLADALKNDRLTDLGYRSRRQELGQAIIKSYPDQEIAKYQTVARHARLWHGTGRYQYKNGRISDVLSQIVSFGGLRTAPDSYAIMLGGEHMESLSVTPLRIIARSYADTYGDGALEKNRYGNSLWWVAYYYGPFYAQAFTVHAAKLLKHHKRWNEATSDEHGERAWGKKVNKSAKHVWDVFGLGSDIDANYPILIGIKHQDDIAVLPKALAKTEIRLTRPVKLEDITHLEVPEEKVAETRNLLNYTGFMCPVFPIELGECVAATQSIKDLLSPR